MGGNWEFGLSELKKNLNVKSVVKLLVCPGAVQGTVDLNPVRAKA